MGSPKATEFNDTVGDRFKDSGIKGKTTLQVASSKEAKGFNNIGKEVGL